MDELNTDKKDGNDQPMNRKPRSTPSSVVWLIIAFLLLIFFGYQGMRLLINKESAQGVLIPSVQESTQINLPEYESSLPDVDGPFGISISQDGSIIYVTESRGERLIKAFNPDGDLLFSFSPPGSSSSDRILTYLAVSKDGKVFVSDNYDAVIDIFDKDGTYLDAIIASDITLSKWIKSNTGRSPNKNSTVYYDRLSESVIYQPENGELQTIPGPDRTSWNPLGLRFDFEGNLLVTNLVAGQHQVLVFPSDSLTGDLAEWNPNVLAFGSEGSQPGQFSYPNSVVRKISGDFYVSDGNNGRISTWSTDQQYLSFFGYGSSEHSLNIPRGLWIDDNQHLYVVDTVGQTVRVFDVSRNDPQFLFNFGSFGLQDASFNFPTDIVVDSNGRIYITDTGNDRIPIWKN